MRWWFALQTEDEMRFFDDQSKEHHHEVSRNWKSEVRPARRGEWRFEEESVKVDAQRRDQRPERFHDLLEDAVRDFEQDGPSDREGSLPLNFMD